MKFLVAVAILSAPQSADSTLIRLERLGLPALGGEVPTFYSPGARARAESLQTATLAVLELVGDSLGASPQELRIAVLDEKAWPRVAPWGLPYGIHTVAGPPHVFVVPSEVDRGQYFDSTRAEPELGVDLIGLHYLAHHLASAVYPSGLQSEPPVKWLDEVLTLIVQEPLYRAFDPRLADLSAVPGPEVEELQVTTLAGFEQEYNGYFSTREGAPNYQWFIERLGDVAQQIIELNGWAFLRQLREHLDQGFDSDEAMSLLVEAGIDLPSIGLAPG